MKGTRQASGGRQGEPASRLSVAIVDARGTAVRVPGLAAWLRRVSAGRASGAATIALIGDSGIRRLNRVYRGVDRVTDVLSFPTTEPGRRGSVRGLASKSSRHSAIGAPSGQLGDIVIATGQARRQARAARHSLGAELRILALHGLLHLLGYDHAADRGRMARLERHLRRVGRLREGLIERSLGQGRS